MFSKTFMAAAMLATATAGDSELFLIDQALNEYSMELAAEPKKKAPATPADSGAAVPPTSPLSPMTLERKGGACSFFTSATGQAFSFKGVDLKMKAANSKPATLTFLNAISKN
jgi:hypothetical protein